jgi:hypothetical protein
MPLTAKGREILAAMKKNYGSEKGEQVFYASKNAGKISSVDEQATSVPLSPASGASSAPMLDRLRHTVRSNDRFKRGLKTWKDEVIGAKRGISASYDSEECNIGRRLFDAKLKGMSACDAIKDCAGPWKAGDDLSKEINYSKIAARLAFMTIADKT